MSKPCKECKQIKSLDSFHTHPKMKDGHLSQCKDCRSSRNKERYVANRERGVKYTSYWKQKGININQTQYEERLAAQGNCCKICGRHQETLFRALAVDHDHTTGKIRGLLCTRCNSFLLPLVERFQHLIIKANEYLGQK